MIIKKVHITKFRGFNNVEFELGSQITVIAGQNGTQKTTLLGILSQTFSLNKESAMYKEKPLCGGNYRSSFNDKFKLSSKFDLAKSHEWSLYINGTSDPFTVESILRDKETGAIRFWKKGSKEKGDGYLRYPTIYLSLKRLLPIGEDSDISQSNKISLSDKEKALFAELHNRILRSQETIKETNYLESQNKNTLGVSTDYYDWEQNSAGQDNVGKIILAILSFLRLKKKYPEDYNGGLLVIDELDATMYPGSQTALLEVLRKYASKLNLQIIFTTHSLSLLEKCCDLQLDLSKVTATANQLKVVYLEKRDHNIDIINNATIHTIKNRLNIEITLTKKIKVDVFAEDKEAILFFKKLIGKRTSLFNFVDVTIPCSVLADLVYRKVPSFSFPNSIIVLDGDTRTESSFKIKLKNAKNIIILPTADSPERIFAKMLHELSDNDSFWPKINPDYNKQFCFRDYTYSEILSDRDKAKKWFNGQNDQLEKKWFPKVLKHWMNNNNNEYQEMLNELDFVYTRIATERNIT